MATASPPESPAPPRRAFRPRFSLAAILVVVTLCAVGLWYWYRVPFEVVRIRAATKELEIREVETLRRVWGGTVRHGSRRIYRDWILTTLESYQEGVRHGPWEWRTDAGELILAVEFDRGRAIAINPGKGCDQRLSELFVNDAIDEPKIRAALLENSNLTFRETPLKDVAVILQDQHNMIPIVFDMRAIQGHELEHPVTCDLRDVPLMVSLGTVLQPVGLVCDYRYSALWITTPALTSQERTGVSKLVPPPGSNLAKCWEKGFKLDLIKTAPQTALSITSKQTQHPVAFDLSRLPPEFVAGQMPGSSVTLSISGVPFKHGLAIVLDRLGCQARLDGETIVVELQPPEASDAQ